MRVSQHLNPRKQVLFQNILKPYILKPYIYVAGDHIFFFFFWQKYGGRPYLVDHQ